MTCTQRNQFASDWRNIILPIKSTMASDLLLDLFLYL